MTAYYNIHGRPLNVSARDAVREIEHSAVVVRYKLLKGECWQVRRSDHPLAAVIGTAATEEAAWRNAWSRMLADAMTKKDGK